MNQDGVLEMIHQYKGSCPVCEKSTVFTARHDGPLDPMWHKNWYSASLICENCGSYPRQRTLFEALNMLIPNWRDIDMHECSPDLGASSQKLAAESKSYVASQYDRAIPFGSLHPEKGYRSENIEEQTFPDNAFDLVITQHVFEHIFHPDLAIREIARTLRPGGYYIMTMPWGGVERSIRRASLLNGEVVHHMEPIYHGNPIDDEGSLVTIDWGYDVAGYLNAHSGLATSILLFDNLEKGMRGSSIDVIACRKLAEIPIL